MTLQIFLKYSMVIFKMCLFDHQVVDALQIYTATTSISPSLNLHISESLMDQGIIAMPYSALQCPGMNTI